MSVDAAGNFLIPIATFIAGFIVSRFTMSKKERKDHSAQLQGTSNALLSSLNEQFERFASALEEYSALTGSATVLEFGNVARSGESYFGQLRMICDTILSGNIHHLVVSNTHCASVRDAVERTLPAFFETMQSIAGQAGIPYEGELRHEDYQSIYGVYEKYCS